MTLLVAAIAATVAAIVSGLAPGRLAVTDIVGKSTCGSGETGSSLKPMTPASAIPMVSSVVATGRSTNKREKFMALAGGAPDPRPGG